MLGFPRQSCPTYARRAPPPLQATHVFHPTSPFFTPILHLPANFPSIPQEGFPAKNQFLRRRRGAAPRLSASKQGRNNLVRGWSNATRSRSPVTSAISPTSSTTFDRRTPRRLSRDTLSPRRPPAPRLSHQPLSLAGRPRPRRDAALESILRAVPNTRRPIDARGRPWPEPRAATVRVTIIERC